MTDWATCDFDPSIFDALDQAHAVRVKIARATLGVPGVSPAALDLVIHLLDASRHYGQLEGVARAATPTREPGRHAFRAGWQAAREGDQSGPLR